MKDERHPVSFRFNAADLALLEELRGITGLNTTNAIRQMLRDYIEMRRTRLVTAIVEPKEKAPRKAPKKRK